MTSIYATTISYENFIIINNKTIELSGNIFMKKDVTISDGLLTTNSVVPNVTNSASLGSTSKIWSNAYISDVSATNIELSGNIVPLNANSSSLGSSVKPFSNAYLRDVSISNIELSGNIVPLNANRSTLGSTLKPFSNAYISDVSVTNIELSGNIIPLNANSSRLGSSVKPWNNAYLSDVSITNIELSGNIIPLNANSSALGSSLKPFSNAYISDVSASAIELSGNIVPLNANRSTLGSALKPFSNAYLSDVSATNIELSGNIVPLNANRSTLGSSVKPFSNAYISDVSATNIELSGNIVPLNANRSTLGTSLKPYSNAYISDVSITNIDVNGRINVAGATNFSNTLEISGNVTFGGSNLYVPSSFTIDPMGHGDNTGTVLINGNLVVQGVTTTINSSVLDISDKMIVLASNVSNAIQADGAGFEISGAKVSFLYNNSSASFRSSIGISISGNVVPLASTGSLGSSLIPWSNAYISDISATNIELSGNIVPLNANRSTLGAGLKPWSNAYIRDVSVTNIELSGNIVPLNANRSALGSNIKPFSNAYISDVSITNIELSGNIIPLNANRYTLGSALKPFSNAYLSDASITNIELSGNIIPLNANRSSLGSSVKPWSNAYISDVSISNIELSGNILPLNANRSTLGSGLKPWSNAYLSDVSITNIELSGNIVPLNANRSTLGSSVKPWSNAYIIDASITNIELSGNIVPLNANRSTLGSSVKPWSNTYIRDVSVTNIEFSGNIVPLNANSSTLGSSLKRWNNVFANDLSVNTINGQAYSAGGGGGGGSVNVSSVSSNIVPSSNNTYRLGSTTLYWNNAYINNLRVSNRVEEKYLNDISYSYSQYPLGPLFGRPFFDATYNNTVSSLDTNIALNSDGTILAHCMTQNNGNYGYINVYKYSSVDASWIQLGQRLTGSSQAGNVQYISTGYGDGFLNISDDGYRISTGMNLDNGNQIYGARIYNYNGSSWNIIGDLSGIENGTTIIGTRHIHVLSGDGNTIALQNDYTNFPNQLSNQMGQIRIYRYQGTGTSWTRLGNDISGTGTASLFMLTLGGGLGISYDGNTIVASTRLYPRYTGMAGFQGIARVFKYNATSNTWNIIGEFLGPGTDVNTWKEFGFGFGGTQISGDGLTVAVTTQYAGIYVYKYINSSWQSALVGSTASGNIRLSYDGNTLLTNNQEIYKYRLNTWVKITTIPVLVSNLRRLSLSRDGSTFGYHYYDTITTPINNGSIRVYQITTNTNTCYGLAKDAYPSLNPRSSGVKAVQTWTTRTLPVTDTWWRSVCWSPELGIFVAVAEAGTNNNRVMTSPNGITWTVRTAAEPNGWNGVCWSPELRRFIAVATGGNNRVMTSTDGTTWSSVTGVESQLWRTVCWSKELAIFVALAQGSNRVITSPNGTSSSWTPTTTVLPADIWRSVIWCPELNIFVAASQNGSIATSINGTTWINRSTPVTCSCMSVCWSQQLGLFVVAGLNGVVMTSVDGITWFASSVPVAYGWDSVCWSPELETFLIIAEGTTLLTSGDGINWTPRSTANGSWHPSCWSPELGIFVAIDYISPQAITSSLKGRPPTSYNLFDSSFNSIDETGKWTFTNVATTTLTVNTTNYPSDDRLKHNEVVIANGLEIMDRLNPKFYQKTLTMLDASYNGDLSGLAWNYEAGLIAQEVLQIPDLSFAVSGGDYYLERYNYYDLSDSDLSDNDLSANDTSANDLSANTASANITSLNYYNRNNNYEVSYNLITQAYAINYNNIFVYGLAAIKELHQKVKAQEATMLEQQTIITSLTARMEALETGESPEAEPVAGPGGRPTAEPVAEPVPNNN